MKNYELVVVLDPQVSKDELKNTVSAVEEVLGKTIQQKDDMGLQNLAYQFKKSKIDQAYIISYYLLCDPQQVAQMKKDMIFIKGILRSMFFAMKPTEKFWTFAELEKRFAKEEVAPKEEVEEAVSQEEVSEETKSDQE